MTEARRANFAAAIVILLAGALSSIWVFLVPIFQAPDEPAHFDYAISIYSAQRLIRLSDGTPDWIVSPYTKYLMQASDFDRIARHSSMRVPPGYGSRTYIARVDAGAPRLRATLYPHGKINYIVPLYPFGFYALEALWMRAASLFTGSIVGVFFAARLLCVFLLMTGLYFNYRTALNLGVSHWTSVALTAAIGFFPLTSFISSYIQPDNMAYALVSATLFFASELRIDVPRLSRIAALGVSLGLLGITKYQFFITAGLPTAILLAVSLPRLASSRARAAAIAVFVTPSVVLFAVQHWVMIRSTAAVAPTTISVEYLRGVIATGLGATLHYIVMTTASAFTDCFVSGGCAITFWQVVGWFDTPVVILNATVEARIRAAISLATVAVFVVITYRMMRNSLRLAMVVAHRKALAALRVAADDPVFNSYLCFLALIFVLYVVSNNAFTAEGRHWYPYIFPAFLCFVWYAPRALSKHYRIASSILACTLLGYVLLAASYALVDVRQRYYGPPLPGYVATDPAAAEISSRNAGVLFPVTMAAYNVDGDGAPFAFVRGSRLTVGGLAVLPEANVVPSTVAVVVDSHTPIPVLADQYVSNFAEATHGLSNGNGAFYANIATERLGEGAHTVVAYAQRLHERRYDRIPPVRLFFLTSSDGRFSPRRLRVIQRGPRVAGSVGLSGLCRGDWSRTNGTAAIAQGSVILFSGRVGGTSPDDVYSGVWLLADDRPYPARYKSTDHSFEGTLPIQNLAIGVHHVTAYAIASPGGVSVRISGPVAFRVAAGDGTTEFLAQPPAACSDTLRQLASI